MNAPGPKVFLRNVVIKDYKSIHACDVDLSPVTFLVGPNGSGKSNFLDAIRFVKDSLRSSVEQAIRERGGIDNVRRRSSGRPNHLNIRLELEVGSRFRYTYQFEIGARPHGGFSIQTEQCVWKNWNENQVGQFIVKAGKIVDSSGIPGQIPVPADKLFLSNVSGFPGFRELYLALSSMGFYNLNPEIIKTPQLPDAGDLLTRDGSNLASVLNNLGKTDPDQKDRLIEYLSQIVPGIRKVEREPMGPMESLNFLQKMGNSKTSKKFWAFSMSDGTLRALGVLTALFQLTGRKHLLSLVAIEEPEMALHPGASGVLLDALREASEERQVLVTSHSPELLDRKDIDAESILAVIQDDEETKIGKLTEGKKNLLKRHVSTAGELLRQNQLRPDLRAIPSSAKLQMKLKF